MTRGHVGGTCSSQRIISGGSIHRYRPSKQVRPVVVIHQLGGHHLVAAECPPSCLVASEAGSREDVTPYVAVVVALGLTMVLFRRTQCVSRAIAIQPAGQEQRPKGSLVCVAVFGNADHADL